jgi:hypothetical protein
MYLPTKLRVAAVFAAVCASAIVPATDAQAADEMIGFGKEKFQLNLGYYRPNYTTSAGVATNGAGATISGEDDLHLDSSVGVGRLDGYWRFADRHKLSFGYYDLSRDATGTLNRNIGPIKIDRLGVNDTVLAGSSISANSNWQMYALGYSYSFYKTDTVELAALLALNVAKMSYSLTGTLNTLNNGVLSGARAGSTDDVYAPLPVIGLSGDWALSERWRLKGRVAGFKANISDYDIKIAEAGLMVDYRVMKNFGVGAGYSFLKMSGDISKSDWTGSLDWKTGGFTVYGSLVF